MTRVLMADDHAAVRDRLRHTYQRALVRRVRELAMKCEQFSALRAVEDWPNVDGSDFGTADRVTRDGQAHLTC
jgi:hypothetical protein